MNNYYNNDITSLQYTGNWFLKATIIAVCWLLFRKLISHRQEEAELQSKARYND